MVREIKVIREGKEAWVAVQYGIEPGDSMFPDATGQFECRYTCDRCGQELDLDNASGRNQQIYCNPCYEIKFYWRFDWRSNPLVQQSTAEHLREKARDLIRGYVQRGNTMDAIAHSMGSYSPGNPATEKIIGGYLIPGKNGVKISNRQIGVLLEYKDGRVEWGVFALEEIYREIKQGSKPRQLSLWEGV